MRQLLLIMGVPATGKTTVGDYLRDNNGFHHINFEDGVSLNRFVNNPRKYLDDLSNKEKIIISWGFVPVEEQIYFVNLLISYGFKAVWFEGDPAVSLAQYIKRGRGKNLEAYYLQMYRITSSKIVERINPQIINTYDNRGGFKELILIKEELGI